MKTWLTRILKLSMVVTVSGGLAGLVFTTNCGGSGGMRTGAAGNNATAGTTGSAGTMGSAGATGTAGVTGTGGRNVCPATQDLTCGASALKLPDGHVTDFSMMEWSVPDGKYCNTSGLRGSVFSYAAPAVADAAALSSASQGVDAPAGNFRLTLTAGPGEYAGGGISFDRCVDVTQFNALRYTVSVASGDVSMCVFKAYLQIFEQRPTDQSPPGSCDRPGGASCFKFPASPAVTGLSSTPMVVTVPFTDLTVSPAPASPAAGQLVGLQWQIDSGAATTDGGPQPSCTAEIRIDDIAFVTQ